MSEPSVLYFLFYLCYDVIIFIFITKAKIESFTAIAVNLYEFNDCVPISTTSCICCFKYVMAHGPFVLTSFHQPPFTQMGAIYGN